MATVPCHHVLADAQRYGRRGGCVWRWCADRVLVLGPDGRPHHVRGRAAFVWSVLDGPRTVHELGAVLAAWTSGADPDMTEGEAAAAVVHLLDAGLVVELGSQ